MHTSLIIRPETAKDIQAIHDVTAAAFQTLAISQQTEPYIIAALRAADALTLSLVAELEGSVVGHIAFSPITISDGSQGWYGLGPISVLPALHRQGIGKALMREGLAKLKEMGAQGCCLVGDPGFYSRFGFKNIPELTFESIPQEVFLALPFGNTVPKGAVTFHEGFKATS